MRHNRREDNGIRRQQRLLTAVLAGVLCAGLAAVPSREVQADKVSDLQAQKQQTESEISAAASSQAALQDQQQAVSDSIDATNAELVQNMASIQMLQDQIDDLNDQIEVKQQEYDSAKAEEDRQYAAMKERIRFMYEKGDISYLQILAKANSFSDILNKAEYINELYAYDRDMLKKFQDIQADVKDKQAALEADKDELETSVNEMEVEQTALQSQLTDLQAEYADYETRLADARSQASTLAEKLQQQNADLKSAIAEKEKAEAAAKAAAEAKAKAEAEARAAADAKAKEEAEAKAKAASAAAEQAQKEVAAADEAVKKAQSAGSSDSFFRASDFVSTSSDTDSDSGSGSGSVTLASTSSGVTGQDVVNFACQFVGNPYVYGGTSLTNGADCSGFTQSVYKNFGIYIGRTDVDQRSAGIAVDSLADALPGDLICYPGHVAIYCGNNTIVHASTAATGIKYSNADYRAYVCIRRLIY